MASTILILGGTGKVGSRIARQLSSQQIPILVASRQGTASQGVPVVFDWNNRETWEKPFTAATASIGAIYLVAPPSLDADRIMNEFIDFARERGVRRFVLQSASSVEAGGPAMGKVHAYLKELGQRGEVDWAALRPTWFQENFAEQPFYSDAIKEESKIYSATGGGKVPFVSADDIAAVAVRALTNPDPSNTEYLVLGPELLSYSDIADILTQVLGKTVVHIDLMPAGLEERHQKFGLPKEYATMLSAMDTSIKFGAEDRTNDVILAVTGAAPKKFKAYAESAKAAWL
ncbi:Festuclavine dehydrogenase [Madurella mycetomatis]|uniref:Festuclavine dehydrogenase n=1 Tax=Madurella mycetomatis TaxID=100816 RepID=A0A175WDP9_9PEZI|nr:Festuclavine dehydrogenase [Madurella mycetomatis]